MTSTRTALIARSTPGLERCFFFDEVEDSYDIHISRGALPRWLRGCWYINGPARFERAGRRYSHWLDGDGMICAMHFGAETRHFTNRFIRTRKWTDEESAGRFLYRGFGTAFAGDLLRRNVMLESPANVSIFQYDDNLLAFGEQTLPYSIDPVTLETRGEFDFDGMLNPVSPLAAHAKVDGGLMNFGVSFSASQPMLNTYEFDKRAGLRRRRFRLDHQYSIHDFGFTERHMVFFLSPLIMNFERFRSDGASIMDALSWEPELGSRILVTPRRNCADEPFTIDAGGGYMLHMINCFETAAHLIADLLLLDAPVYNQYRPLPDLFISVPRSRPVRYIVDLATRELAVCPIEYEVASDFPSIDPTLAGHSYSDFWMLTIPDQHQPGPKFFTQLARGSWAGGGVADIYQAPAGEYLCGEPCFVANPSDRSEGLVICEHFQPNLGAANIVLFDAFHLSGGPVASFDLRHPIHPGFHSTFVPAAQGTLQ